MSTRRVFRSADARLAARLIAVVVLPTPPFWFEMQIVRDTVLLPMCRKPAGVLSSSLRRKRGRRMDSFGVVGNRSTPPIRSVPRGTFCLSPGAALKDGDCPRSARKWQLVSSNRPERRPDLGRDFCDRGVFGLGEHRDYLPARRDIREREAKPLRQRGYRARNRHLGHWKLLGSRPSLCASLPDANSGSEPQLQNGVAQERDFLSDRIHQRHIHRRAEHLQGNAGKTRAGTDV